MPRFSYGLAYAGISSLDSAPSAGGGDSIVTPPAATSQAVAAGGSLAAVTFGTFTDADGVIDNYLVGVQNSAGSAAVSGSGLGAYTFGSTADGNAGVVTLTARNAANQPLATAVHTFSIAAAVGGLVSLLDWSSVTYDFLSTEHRDQVEQVRTRSEDWRSILTCGLPRGRRCCALSAVSLNMKGA